jgi:hypothetical protein
LFFLLQAANIDIANAQTMSKAVNLIDLVIRFPLFILLFGHAF